MHPHMPDFRVGAWHIQSVQSLSGWAYNTVQYCIPVTNAVRYSTRLQNVSESSRAGRTGSGVGKSTSYRLGRSSHIYAFLAGAKSFY